MSFQDVQVALIYSFADGCQWRRRYNPLSLVLTSDISISISISISDKRATVRHKHKHKEWNVSIPYAYAYVASEDQALRGIEVSNFALSIRHNFRRWETNAPQEDLPQIFFNYTSYLHGYLTRNHVNKMCEYAELLPEPTLILSRPRNHLSAMWQYWWVNPMCVISVVSVCNDF